VDGLIGWTTHTHATPAKKCAPNERRERKTNGKGKKIDVERIYNEKC
jgi:hypothetical protein